MSGIHDPRVMFAIQKRYAEQARKRNRAAVREALERIGAGSLKEIMEIAGLDREDCGRALDDLRLSGQVVLNELQGLFVWSGSESGKELS